MVRNIRYGGLAAAVCFLAGCQGGPRVNGYIEQMAAERRALEDRVYQLEYDLEVIQSELDHAQSENVRLRGDDPAPSGRSETRTVPRSSPPRRSPSIGRTNSGIPDDALLKPPVVEPGVEDGELESTPDMAEPPVTPRRFTPVPDSPAGSSSPELNAPPRNQPAAPPAQLPPPTNDNATAPADESPPVVEPIDEGEPVHMEGDSEPDRSVPRQPALLAPPLAPASAVSEYESADQAGVTAVDDPDAPIVAVRLIPDDTTGVDLDDKDGDDGVTVAFQLRDDRGRLARTPGAISVVVLDLAQQGPAARVARWDLDAEQVARLLPDGSTRDGLVLHMAWPDTPPKREQLQLHIRYVTDDGRKLEDHRDITIRLPGSRGLSANHGAAGSTTAGGWRTRSSTESNGLSEVVPASAEMPLAPLPLHGTLKR